jgi:hypothetical protein
LNDPVTSYGSDALSAASVTIIDANASFIGGDNGYAEHRGSGSWGNAAGAASPLQLLPGKGYMIIDPVKSNVNWTQTR